MGFTTHKVIQQNLAPWLARIEALEEMVAKLEIKIDGLQNENDSLRNKFKPNVINLTGLKKIFFFAIFMSVKKTPKKNT